MALSKVYVVSTSLGSRELPYWLLFVMGGLLTIWCPSLHILQNMCRIINYILFYVCNVFSNVYSISLHHIIYSVNSRVNKVYLCMHVKPC